MSINKILIAEDELYIARVLKLVLVKEGFEVLCVSNGREALKAYTKSRPDLIITDVKMPHMTGHELVDAIRRKNADVDTPIIVMTSTLESENRDWVSGIANVSFVGKPVSPRELVRIANGYFLQTKAS